VTPPAENSAQSPPSIPATGRAIDHRTLAALVTRFAIDHYHAAVRLRETAGRMTDAAQALLDDGEDAGRRTLRQSVAFSRTRQWEKWQDLAVWAETDAKRQAIQAVRAWEEAYDSSTDLRHEATGWPSRAVIVEGRLYLAVPADPDDGGQCDRLVILDPVTALVDVGAAVALGVRPPSPDDEAREAAAALGRALTRIAELQPEHDRLAAANRGDDPDAAAAIRRFYVDSWDPAEDALARADRELVAALKAAGKPCIRVGRRLYVSTIGVVGMDCDAYPEQSVVVDLPA
jgi:hypothetical protein